MAIGISSKITTKNAADTYATHLANLGRGGAHSKDSIAQMNSITTDRRFRFMLCVVANTGSGSPGLYWLNTPPNPSTAQLADNNNWQPVPLGISSEGVLSLLGFQNASSLTILDSVGSTGDTYIVDVGGSVNGPNIFGGQAVTLVVGDYLVYNDNQWNVVPTGATSVNWNTLAGKPTTFTPSPHTHVIADITDFPDLTGYLTDQDVVNTITDQTNSVLLGNVGAIRDYVTAQINNIIFPEVDLSNYYTKSETQALIDAIEGYTLYTSPSLVQLNIDVPNPNEGEFAFIQGEYAMYRYESAQWVKKYETANPSSDEAKFLNNDVTDTITLKALGTAALSENNYILYRDSGDTFLKVYKLVFGTATESLPEIVLPDDYNATTNAKYWQLAESSGYTSSDFDTDLATKTTDDVAEGATNLYNKDRETSTGILSGGALEIEPLDNTQFLIRAGKGYKVDNSTVPVTVQLVEWNDIRNIPVTDLATAFNTDVALSFNAQGNATVLQQRRYTNAELRNVIFLGGLDHSNQTNISLTFSIQVPAYAASLSVRDLAEALGDIKLAGGLIQPNGANLSIDRTEVELFSFGRNAVNNINNPHDIILPEAIQASFNYIFNDNGEGAVQPTTTVIDPNNYDAGNNILTAVPNNNYTIQKIGIFSNTGSLFIQYGTETFGKLADAKAALNSTTFTELGGFTTLVPLAYLIVKQGTVNLTNTANAEFRSINRFGTTAVSPTVIDQTRNQSTTSVPSSKLLDDELSELHTELSTFNAVLDLSKNTTIRHTVSGAIEFTLGANPQLGKKAIFYLVADGLNAPTFGTGFVEKFNNYDNTQNKVNRCYFEYVGNNTVIYEVTYV